MTPFFLSFISQEVFKNSLYVCMCVSLSIDFLFLAKEPLKILMFYRSNYLKCIMLKISSFLILMR